MTKKKFYSLERILKTNSTYNVVFGERSNGKTYSVLKYAVEQYFKNGGRVAVVRRWKEDVTGARASGVFSALNSNGEISEISDGEFQGITYQASKFYLCNYDESGKPIYNDSDLIGHTFALSDSEHNKSISYPKVTTILFDEFLTKHLYLQDEFVLFMNTISTIVRKRTDVKIFMLGNTVNRYSPYFAEMGLTHIQDMEQGSIDVYKYGADNKLRVAVEYAESLQGKDENNFYFAFNNPKLQMITDGAWELDIYPHIPIKYKPKHVVFSYFIQFNDSNYQCDVVVINSITFTYIHEKTTVIKYPDKDLVYSLDYSAKPNYVRNIYNPESNAQKRILWYYKHDRVFYQNNSVGDSIQNYLKICKGG